MTAMEEQQELEVGGIPAGWSIASLGDLGRCIRGVSYKPEHLMQETGEGVTTLLRSNNIKNDRVNFDDVQFVAGCKISEDQLARPFDIAICMSNGSKALVGKSGVVTPAHLARHPKLTVGAFCAIYRSPVQYTAQILKSQFFQSAIDVRLAGSAINNLKGSDIEGIRFPLPPLEEQQKIAAILTAVDDKLDVIARQIEATQTLKQGLMQTLFSRGVGTQDADGRWVPHAEFKDSEQGEIPVGWTVAPLGELIEKLMDFRGRTPKKLGMDWGGGDIPALSANNVRMGYIDFDRECYLGSDELYAAWMVQGDTRKNDLVFTMEAPLGNVAVIPNDRRYILSQRVVLLRANQRVKHSYLFQYLRSDTFGKILEANSTGTTAKGIQQKRLVQLPVVVPHPEEQGRIADMLGAVDSKLDALLSKQSHHQTLKRGLMQKLLTGEWRVNVDVSATGN